MDPTRRGRRDEEKQSDGTAGLILILLILVLVIAASIPALLPSGSAAADRLPIFLSIGGGDSQGESGTGLRLSIITDFFARLFGGSSEGTYLLSRTGGTPGQVRTLPPEFTETPFDGPTETETPTGTIVAFGTAGPSPTPSMTGTPGPTKSGTDNKDPQLSGGGVSPGSGSTISCTTTPVTISGLVVHDPDFSSGMNHVQLKYQIEGSGYVYGPELTLVSGGWTSPGKTWHATYDGGIKIDGESGSNLGAVKAYALAVQTTVTPPTNTPSPTATETPTPTATLMESPTPGVSPTATAMESPTPNWTPDPTPGGTQRVEVYAYAEDNSGNSATKHVATYYLPASCP